jgi:protein-L-isoaspartate(D-aspartate) O-methyltransferase
MPNFDKLRENMVYNQIIRRGITDDKLLNAFREVPRHLFVPLFKRSFAYEDYPISIGEGQTISQPYIVALMTQLCEITKGEKVLEIGTGSGYQAAIIAYLGGEVYTIERIASLAKKAKETLYSLNFKVKIKVGDGSLGWPEYAPYDKIMVTAASPSVSPCWQEQLKIGGRIVLPLGEGMHQDLTVVEKISHSELKKKTVCGCVFVPLIGSYGYKE